jgi:hypothetical protein
MSKLSSYSSISEDIIQEERESIIRDSNTAQSQLENIIDKLKPEIVDLNLQSSFSGELDLTIIGTKFPRLRSLLFGPGKITTIRNIPSGISKFICNNNLLMSLEKMPGSLLYLDIDHNYVKTIDLSKTPYLEELHCSNNRLENLLQLPKSITKLYCDQNKLKELDLTGKSHLKILHVSNNPLLIVNNVPEDIHEYVAENNPLAMEKTSYDYVEWDDMEEIDEKIKDLDKKHRANLKIKYTDALNTYFKIKQSYESDLLKRRRVAFKKGATKQSGMKRSQSVKGKCVQCKRTVGMFFRTSSKGYTAICGDKVNSCGLNIELFRGKYYSNEYYINVYKELLEEEKTEIIRQKLDSLFNYISAESSVKEFKKKLESYNDALDGYTYHVKIHNDLFHNVEKKELISKKQDQIYKILSQIQNMIDEHKSTNPYSQHAAYGGSVGLLHTAMEVYVTDLLPEIDNLRRLKYEIVEMDQNTVFQKDVTLYKLDLLMGEPPSIVRFRGV